MQGPEPEEIASQAIAASIGDLAEDNHNSLLARLTDAAFMLAYPVPSGNLLEAKEAGALDVLKFLRATALFVNEHDALPQLVGVGPDYVQYLVDYMEGAGMLPEHYFTFPDGDTYWSTGNDPHKEGM